jgi:hypothetical protein
MVDIGAYVNVWSQGADVPILLEIPHRFIAVHALSLAYHFGGYWHGLTLLQNFGFVETVDLLSYLLRLHLPLVVDLDLEKLHPTNPAHGILGQHTGNQPFHKSRTGSWKLQLFAIKHFYEIGYGIGLERTDPKDHLVQHHSQRPDVCLVRVYFPFEHFRRHIDRRSEHSLGHLISGVEILAETEVTQLDDTVMEEDVVGLHVAVHDVVLVEDLEGLKQLFEDEESVGL